jgi:hypothetical protein
LTGAAGYWRTTLASIGSDPCCRVLTACRPVTRRALRTLTTRPSRPGDGRAHLGSWRALGGFLHQVFWVIFRIPQRRTYLYNDKFNGNLTPKVGMT